MPPRCDPGAADGSCWTDILTAGVRHPDTRLMEELVMALRQKLEFRTRRKERSESLLVAGIGQRAVSTPEPRLAAPVPLVVFEQDAKGVAHAAIHNI